MFWKLQENVISEADLEEMIGFIRTTRRFTQFERVREFETAFAAWQGSKYAVFVNSGSSANLILVNAARELYQWPGDSEIIVPAVTWTTTVTPVMQLGLAPVFVDCNLQDVSFDYEALERAITPRTRAIFLAHLLGFPVDIARLRRIIGSRPIQILEDCCESQGAHIDGVKVGNFGVGGTFSFYWGHHMTTVEGGMVVTNDVEMYKLLLLKRSHGLARELPPSMHDEVKRQNPDIDFNFLFLTDGFNVRNTEFAAVLGLTQLAQVDSFIEIRNRNYDRFLQIIRHYNTLIPLDHPGRSAFVFPFLCASPDIRRQLQARFMADGIESRPLISGNLLRQPFLKKWAQNLDLPNADFMHTNAFYIGNNQFVDDARLDHLEAILADVMPSA